MPQHPEEVRIAYARSNGDPIVCGDRLHFVNETPDRWIAVRSFRWSGGIDPSHTSDYYSLETPDGVRTVDPKVARECARRSDGVRPPLRLGQDRIRRVDIVSVSRLQKFLEEPLLLSGPRTLRASEILSAIRSAGYDVWLVGGSVRDAVLLGKQLSKDSADVDVSGTALFHELYRILEFVCGASLSHFELRAQLSTDQTVLSLRLNKATNSGQDRILEYAPLKRAPDGLGWEFDHSLSDDVRWRDLTMNCMFYDERSGWMLDPTGEGEIPLQPIELPQPCPQGHAANTLFRLLKFVDREAFRQFSLEYSRNFVRRHLDTCCADFASLRPGDPGPRGRVRVLLRYYGSKDKMDKDLERRQLRQVCDRIDLTIWSSLGQLLSS